MVRSWDECERLTKGHPGARQAKFISLREAQQFISRPEGALEQGEEANRFYAIASGRGRFRGVVESWGECIAKTRGVSNARFRRFNDARSAREWLAELDVQGRGV